MMCDKEMLVAFLYDELQDAERPGFERHLAACAACREELRALRATRAHLASWTSPVPAERDGQPQIVPRATPQVREGFRIAPAWGLAAAAVLVLAAAAAVASVEIRVGSEGVVITTGRQARTAAQPATQSAPAAPAESPVLAELEAVQKRLRALEAELAARPAVAPAPAAGRTSQADGSDILRQVRQLVQQSETRQQRELAIRIGQLVRDLDTARRADFVRIQQGLMQIQGRTDETFIRQQRMENTILRAVHQQER